MHTAMPQLHWDGQCLLTLFLRLVVCRGSSAVCVYSFGDIDNVFRTSKLKGYNGPNPEIKPGQVSEGQELPR